MQITPLLIWVGILSLYIPLNHRKYYHLLSFQFDKYIRIIPVFVVPYALFIPWLVFGVCLLWNQGIYLNFILSHIIATSLATIIYIVYPTGVKRPSINNPKTFFDKILVFIYTHDHDNNACPSGHVYSTLITSTYLSLSLPQYLIIFSVVGMLITLSTLFTKQHYLIDVIAGILLALISVLISFWVY